MLFLPRSRNPYTTHRVQNAVRAIQRRNRGQTPKIPPKDQEAILTAYRKFRSAKDAFARYGFRGAEVRTQERKLCALAEKHGLALDELLLLARIAVEN